MRASTCLKLFAVTVPYSQVAIPAVFIEHLCLNETLTELHIDFDRIDHSERLIVAINVQESVI